MKQVFSASLHFALHIGRRIQLHHLSWPCFSWRPTLPPCLCGNVCQHSRKGNFLQLQHQCLGRPNRNGNARHMLCPVTCIEWCALHYNVDNRPCPAPQHALNGVWYTQVIFVACVQIKLAQALKCLMHVVTCVLQRSNCLQLPCSLLETTGSCAEASLWLQDCCSPSMPLADKQHAA